MNSQVCVHCHNEKPVNSTNNRLVTESCGHVKCMDCLSHEKSGCSACIRENGNQISDCSEDLDCRESSPPLDVSISKIVEGKQNNKPVVKCEISISGVPIKVEDPTKSEDEDITKRKKPETSHIKTETDANGRCYICTVCKKTFHARSQVAYHAYCNGQRKPYQCPECNKSFATHSHFKYHMRVHRNERTYACDVCGDSFFQMSKLQRHKLKHTKEKKYACSQCNKAFNNVTSLRKHGLTHTEERPYSCATCGRRFRDSSNYRKHVAKHDEKKCSCSVCGREVGCGRALAAHCLQHERRAHQCPRCPQAFHSSKDMRRHAAVHTDSKPFRCKVCNRHFRRKDNLERHIRNTHPDFVPSAAVECDENALKQIITSNGQTNKQRTEENTDISEEVYRTNEKIKLELLNPLPPLPEEVIQKHMKPEVNENISQNNQEPEVEKEKVAPDKSYILEANIARQSVIFGPVKKDTNHERKITSTNEEFEYVHKIRKANIMASQKHIPLPPIDEKKIIELEQKNSLANLDVGPPPKNVELYKKILYEKPEKDRVSNEDDSKTQHTNVNPEMHWRRKLKLNINW